MQLKLMIHFEQSYILSRRITTCSLEAFEIIPVIQYSATLKSSMEVNIESLWRLNRAPSCICPRILNRSILLKRTPDKEKRSEKMNIIRRGDREGEKEKRMRGE